MTKNRKLLFILGALLLLLAAILFGGRAVGEYRRTHHKLQAEIIYCYSDYNSVLAAEIGNQYGSLFTFGWPEKNADPALKQPGMLVELTGPDGFQLTYPMQYGPVLAVKKTGQREDFIAKHYDALLEGRKQYPAPWETEADEAIQEEKRQEREALLAAINALPDLNDEEREGLYYLVECELNIFS